MKKLLVAVAGLSLSLAAAVPASADGPVRMTGTVVDGSTSQPVAGATVLITDDGGLSFAVKTDRNGQYAALGLESGDYVVRFVASGFYEGDSACHVQSGQTASTEFRAYRGTYDGARINYRCKIELPPTDRTFLE